jgi:hypothetical protein
MTELTKTYMAFRPDAEMAKAMYRLHVRDGITVSVQIRRALEKWLPTKGVGYTPKKEKKR